jgi:hypothetical protein
MKLSTRPAPYILPSYSLTGDLLGFLRCGLQYRYYSVGRLPSSNPVQMWFGQFIHGVLEESFRRYDESRKAGKPNLPPWKDTFLDEIIQLIKDRLAIQGLFPWNIEVENMGISRAKLAINELGPDLFPLIHRAEVRLTGTRDLPQIPAKYNIRGDVDRYEILGIVDVITHVQLRDPQFKNNKIVQLILNSLPSQVPSSFEVIIDYKGMRRPPHLGGRPGTLWDQYNWQIQTYAHLRKTHPDSLPIVAGVLLYINELLPSKEDLNDLKNEIKNKSTDVCPMPGTREAELINKWRIKDKPPTLPYYFRLKRAMRVIPIDDNSIQRALDAFNQVVQRIEICRGKEQVTGKVTI